MDQPPSSGQTIRCYTSAVARTPKGLQNTRLRGVAPRVLRLPARTQINEDSADQLISNGYTATWIRITELRLWGQTQQYNSGCHQAVIANRWSQNARIGTRWRSLWATFLVCNRLCSCTIIYLTAPLKPILNPFPSRRFDSK